MDDKMEAQWETQVRETAVRFTYPPTPDLRKRPPVLRSRPRLGVPRTRLAWVTAVILLLLAGSFLVPQVRAAVIRFFQAGAISIFVPEPTALPSTPVPSDDSLELNQYVSEYGIPVTPAEAQTLMRHPVQLPSELRMPDRFLLDDSEKPTMLVSLWLDETEPTQVALSLYQIEVANFAAKGSTFVEQTRVNGHEAFWVAGPHVIRLEDGRFQSWLFVEGNVLIWWQGDVTYRLEGAGTLETAVTIAESLQTVHK